MTLFAAGPALLLPLALLLDAAMGDPDWLWRRAPHPVVLMGRLIGWLDRMLNRGESDRAKRLAGVAALALLIAATGLAAAALHWLCVQHPLGFAVEVLAVSILLAQRSLYDHVHRVGSAFARGGLTAAREAVSHVVGRDPKALDTSGVCRAAIETTAENFSDGVVAPAFWYLVAGLPGIAIYKAVNTADSMIGHRTAHHRAFGWASARLDDALNFIPARLSGVLTVLAAPLAGGSIADAWQVMLRDAHLHRSPNAGWPEAATAGALAVAIAGPRIYATGPVSDPYVNDAGRKDLHPRDIADTLRLFVAACAVQWLLCTALAFSVLGP
jgi:adenosylcobinamide-phosphate synthase